MDYEQQVRRASGGDVRAFVELTRQFRHMAFGAALILVHDFHQAEEVPMASNCSRCCRCGGTRRPGFHFRLR